MPPPVRPRHILPVIIIAQFMGTALWFAGNAILPDLQRDWGLAEAAVGQTTMAVLIGFVAGAVTFALFMLPDRYSARWVYCGSAVLGAAATLLILVPGAGFSLLLISRFLTGFFLAGIYPVGMKLAASWYGTDLGRALGYLVGALVMGTALPHLVRGLGADLDWQFVTVLIAMIALGGGGLIALFVPEGPHAVPARPFSLAASFEAFRSPRFRASAFGYFGHMWELYTVWAFLPLLVVAQGMVDEGPSVSYLSFLVIAVGAVGCGVGGLVSMRIGSATVARTQLWMSGLCCLVSPIAFLAPPAVYFGFLVAWGVVVVGDSPQLSSLNAKSAPPDLVGSALTIVNSIGFSIAIVSLQVMTIAYDLLGPQLAFLVLLPGPVLGAFALRRLRQAA